MDNPADSADLLTAMDGPDTTSAIAALLAEHWKAPGSAPRRIRDGFWSCSCGAGGTIPAGPGQHGPVTDAHRTHLATVIATSLREPTCP